MVKDQRRQWMVIGLVAIGLFYLLSPILGPFIFSALLAYLGDPLIDKLEKKMSRTWAVTIVFMTIILILVLTVVIIIPLISGQLENLLVKVPYLVDYMQNHLVPFLQTNLDIGNDNEKSIILTTLREHFSNIPHIANRLLQWFTGSANWLIALIMNIFLVPVITFYLLRDWDDLLEKFRSLLPRKREAMIVTIAKESDSMLSAFLRGQFMVMNALAVIYAIGLTVVGVDFAILLGFIAGWLSFVPYLGLVIGLGVASLMAYFQFGDLWHPFGVVVVFVIAQLLEGSVLTPRFVGEKIGLHPVAVIFSVIAGGQLAGFSGVLLALPVAAILNVIISHAQIAYRQSNLYN